MTDVPDRWGTVERFVSPETYSLKHRRLSMEVNDQAPAELMQTLVPHLAELASSPPTDIVP